MARMNRSQMRDYLKSEKPRFEAALKELSKVPLKEIDLDHMTLVQKLWLVKCVNGLDEALRAYYNQHQANGCECELCKNAERALASEGIIPLPRSEP
jgi:hypothetical protein